MLVDFECDLNVDNVSLMFDTVDVNRDDSITLDGMHYALCTWNMSYILRFNA